MRILNNPSLLGATVALMVAATATAQVNYTQTFDTGISGWTGGSGTGYFTGATACGGAGGAIRDNIYFTSANNWTGSPLLGTSFGGAMTLSFDMKVADWSANTVGTAGWGSLDVSYGPTASGPWTSVGTVLDTDDTQDGSTCFTKVFNFTPPAGDLYVRLTTTYGAGDYYMNFDNVSCVEAVAACSGAPAPGDTTVAGTACDGSTSITVGLQNPTTGSGVSYQWYSSLDGVTYAPFGTDAATQSVTQAATTWYYCDVTCATGPDTTASNPIMVDMFAGPTWPNGFGSTATDDCWSTIPGTDPDLTPQWDAADAFGAGTGSFYFDFWASSNLAEASNVSPVFAPVAAGTKVYFDIAGKQYNSAVDVVNLEESNDGGATWTLVAAMDNSATGVANTAGTASFPEFFPTAGEWASLAYDLTAGTDRIRFRAVSNFGNNIFIDNVSVGVIPSARHTVFGAGCGAGPVSLSSATAPLSPSAQVFDATGAPEMFPTAGISAGVLIVDFSNNFAGADISPLLDADCLVYINNLSYLEAMVGPVGTASAGFVIPAAVPPGTVIYEQAAFLIPPTPTNVLGFETSNAVRTFINTF